MPRFLRHLVPALTLAFTILLTHSAQAQRSGEMFAGPPQRNVAGQFDYYALALSWSPTHCASVTDGDHEMQCNRSDGRRYGFVLHGLWPQHERGYPEYCQAQRRAFVPQTVIDAMLDIMPAPKLVIHEYRKHGTCSGLDASGYYALSRKLFQRVKVPDDYVNPFENRMVGPGQVMDAFIAVNPGLKPDMIAVSCGGAGNRMREVRICFNREGAFRACGRNEDQQRLCAAQRMFVPPVRASHTGEEPGPSRKTPPAGQQLPHPRVIPGVGR